MASWRSVTTLLVFTNADAMQTYQEVQDAMRSQQSTYSASAAAIA